MPSLKQLIFDEYNREGRRKTLPSHSTFCVDDRGPSDVASDRSLYGYFCEIIADTGNDPVLEVRLVGNVPLGPEVESWVAANGAVIKEAPRRSLEFSVGPGEEDKLLDLAAAIEIITSRCYDTPSYKYVCPRTGRSLRKLASVLTSARGS